jgi:uncharacterized membrane protein
MKKQKDPFDDPFFNDTDNYMRKQKIKFVATALIIIVLAAIVVNRLFSEGKAMDNQVKSFVGKKVVIEKDTMTVINYSILKSTYTLSNGVEYDMDFVKSKIIIKP